MRKTKSHTYELVNGKTKEVVQTVTAPWSQVEAMVKHKGMFARRVDRAARKEKESRTLSEDEMELHYASKVQRRRKAFLVLPAAQQVSEVIWELNRLGLPCLAEMMKDNLAEAGK